MVRMEINETVWDVSQGIVEATFTFETWRKKLRESKIRAETCLRFVVSGNICYNNVVACVCVRVALSGAGVVALSQCAVDVWH